MGSYDIPDTTDPTDDQDVAAPVIENPEDSDPVEIIPDPEGDPCPVPASWGTEFTEEDWQERLAGVQITDEPDDREA